MVTVTLRDKIKLTIVITLFLASISLLISMIIKENQSYSHFHTDSCKVISCNIISTSCTYTYQWPLSPYYNITYNETDLSTCPTIIKCGYDDRYPDSTFGGWIVCGEDLKCINGTCEITHYYKWVAILGGFLTLVYFVALVILVDNLIKKFKHGEEYLEL